MKRLLLLSCLLLPSVYGQEIQFTFQVYQADPAIGIALEDRLIAGGEGAATAIAKLPDFVRQGRLEELATLSFASPSGERTIQKSEGGLVTLPTREATEGLEVEIDPVVRNGVIDLNIFAAFVSREKGDPIERTLTTQTRGPLGAPMLLCRWQREDEWVLLLGTATIAGGAPAASVAGDVLYIESAYYPSASAAKSRRDTLASTRIPCLNGQRCRSQIIGWIDDENILEDDQPGFRSVLDPKLGEDGTLTLGVNCGHIVEAGGRTRLDSGERVRRLELRDVSDTFTLTEGEPTGSKATVAGLDDVKAEEDDYVAGFTFVRSQ